MGARWVVTHPGAARARLALQPVFFFFFSRARARWRWEATFFFLGCHAPARPFPRHPCWLRSAERDCGWAAGVRKGRGTGATEGAVFALLSCSPSPLARAGRVAAAPPSPSLASSPSLGPTAASRRESERARWGAVGWENHRLSPRADASESPRRGAIFSTRSHPGLLGWPLGSTPHSALCVGGGGMP